MMVNEDLPFRAEAVARRLGFGPARCPVCEGRGYTVVPDARTPGETGTELCPACEGERRWQRGDGGRWLTDAELVREHG